MRVLFFPFVLILQQLSYFSIKVDGEKSVKDDYIAIPCSITVYYKPEMVAFKPETNEMQLELSTSYVQDRFG